MDTVVKSLLEEEEQDKGFVIFGRDVSKIPCFRESFFYGIATGIGCGIIGFVKTSKPHLAQHIGFGSFTMATMIYWSVCRYQWSKQRFDAQLMQEALKERILREGTVNAIEDKLEQEGILKQV